MIKKLDAETVLHSIKIILKILRTTTNPNKSSKTKTTNHEKYTSKTQRNKTKRKLL